MFAKKLLISLLIAFVAINSASASVEINVTGIGSPNVWAAYRVAFHNYMYGPLDQVYTLFKLLPHTRTIAST